MIGPPTAIGSSRLLDASDNIVISYHEQELISLPSGMALGLIAIALILYLWPILITMRKGHELLALGGIVVWPLALLGMVMLAKPDSRWARDRYSQALIDRGRRRYGGHCSGCRCFSDDEKNR